MSKKTIIETVQEEMHELAKTMCDNYCKYGQQCYEDQKNYDDDNPTYIEHCSKCPMIQFYC